MAGGDSDKNEVRFERGLYVGLAAAAAAVGMTVAAYLTAQRIIQHLSEEDIRRRFQGIEHEIVKVKGNPTIALVPTQEDGVFAGQGKPPSMASVKTPAGGGLAGLKRNPLAPYSWDGT